MFFKGLRGTQRFEGIWATETVGGILEQEAFRGSGLSNGDQTQGLLNPGLEGILAVTLSKPLPVTALTQHSPQKPPFTEHLLSAQWILTCN